MGLLAGKKILCIDDDPVILTVVRKVFEKAGFCVREAASVPIALQMLGKEVPHLIITDLNMPQMNGFEFLRRWREMPEAAKVPAIVLSALSDISDVKAAIALGAKDYVLKPLNPQMLLERALKWLQKPKKAQSLSK